VDARIATLLTMIASLEESILRVEAQGDEGAIETVRRLRTVQRDIVAALRLVDK
jgi:hypothetical protein